MLVRLFYYVPPVVFFLFYVTQTHVTAEAGPAPTGRQQGVVLRVLSGSRRR